MPIKKIKILKKGYRWILIFDGIFTDFISVVSDVIASYPNMSSSICFLPVLFCLYFHLMQYTLHQDARDRDIYDLKGKNVHDTSGIIHFTSPSPCVVSLLIALSATGIYFFGKLLNAQYLGLRWLQGMSMGSTHTHTLSCLYK